MQVASIASTLLSTPLPLRSPNQRIDLFGSLLFWRVIMEMEVSDECISISFTKMACIHQSHSPFRHSCWFLIHSPWPLPNLNGIRMFWWVEMVSRSRHLCLNTHTWGELKLIHSRNMIHLGHWCSPFSVPRAFPHLRDPWQWIGEILVDKKLSDCQQEGWSPESVISPVRGKNVVRMMGDDNWLRWQRKHVGWCADEIEREWTQPGVL